MPIFETFSVYMMEERCSITLENAGQKMFGVLHLPVCIKKKVPAVLICHGFGDSKVGPNRLYVNQAQNFANHGIAALRIDFRGSGDSEGDFYDVSLESEVSDAIASLHFLSKHSLLDSSRLGILGCSLGGAISVMTAVRWKTIKSLGLWAPVANGRVWREEWVKDNPDQSIKNDENGGVVYKGKKVGPCFLREFMELDLNFPLQSLNHIPLLHVQGAEDKTVSLSHRQFFQSWRVQASSSKFIKLPETGHSFCNLIEQAVLYRETLQWFQATL